MSVTYTMGITQLNPQRINSERQYFIRNQTHLQQKNIMRKFLHSILYLEEEQQMQRTPQRKRVSRFFSKKFKIKLAKSILENIQHSDNRFLNHPKRNGILSLGNDNFQEKENGDLTTK